MLNKRTFDSRSDDIILRSLTDDPKTYSLCLGCPSCPDFEACGGLSVKAQIIDCLDLCCGEPRSCTSMCANAPERFVEQHQEISGFDLGNLPRSCKRYFLTTENIVPLIYHGGRRTGRLNTPLVAIRLSDIVDYKNVKLKFSSGTELRDKFRLSPNTKIIVTGVDHDREVEAWWKLGPERTSIIKKLNDLQIEAVTAPNFSLVVDSPRTDNLHSIKRIGIVSTEFMDHGIPCAVHPNGRTNTDFERWRDFIKNRNEIELISYEFITGAGRACRLDNHLQHLIDLAKEVDRPLTLILRGDPKIIPMVRPYFVHILYVDTTGFMKTMKRQAAVRADNRGVQWQRFLTPKEESLDNLMSHNLDEQKSYINARYFVPSGD